MAAGTYGDAMGADRLALSFADLGPSGAVARPGREQWGTLGEVFSLARPRYSPG